MSKIMQDKYKNLAIIYINTTKQNIIFTVIQKRNFFGLIDYKTLCCVSPGHVGFKGRKKTTQLALLLILKKVYQVLINNKIKYIKVVFKGINFNKEIILKFLFKEFHKFIIISVSDITQIPHNGCRLKNKKKR
uniref:Ribosomal protein S11 n=1 Tax=Piridium sociabile TaxID=2570542 RepID=A0A5B9XUZ7_9ALVE|nr:ribosomal protein S11 [Piridium sociabile]